MSLEQRVTALEEVSQLLISALRALNESLNRLVASALASGWLPEEERVELSMAMERANQALQTLMTFVPTAYIDVPSLYNVGDILDKAETLLPPTVGRQ